MTTTDQKYQIAEELFRAGAIDHIELIAILAQLEMDRRTAERSAAYWDNLKRDLDRDPIERTDHV
jgi:hypothetical protein